MTEIIPPDMFEEMSKAIGNSFSFRDLDIVLYKCSGERTINSIANEIWPPVKTARECLIATEREGTAMRFLALILEARPFDNGLRELIIRVAPELKDARPETKANVDVVVSQLYKTKSDLKDPSVRTAISISGDSIKFVSRVVEILEIYKNLHDNLHRIQFKQFAELLAAAKRMKQDPSQIETLRDFQDQARTACELARHWADRLSNDAMAQANETSWIDKLQNAAERLQTAIDDRDVATACLVINVVWRVIEIEPSRLNKHIFIAAGKLPLHDLVLALEEVGKVARDDGGGIKKACASLRDLGATLVARAVDHNLWQEVDDGLWAIDKIFRYPAADAVSDFVTYWPPTRTLVRALAASGAEARWSVNARKYSSLVDDELVRIESELDQGLSEEATSQIKTDLYRVYDAFRHEARFRFLQVDQYLKSDCGALVAIAAPLHSILKELEDG